MSIYKRKSGRYAVLVDLEPSATGLRRRKSIGTHRTRKEAEAAERRALEARDRGIDIDPARVTVSEIALRFIRGVEPELAGQTTSRYEEHLRIHVLPHIGGIPAVSLKPAHLAELYAKLRSEKIRYESRKTSQDESVRQKVRYGKPLGSTTVLRIHRLVHRMLGWAERLGLVARNVARIVEAPKATPSPARALTTDQAAAFLASFRRNAVPCIPPFGAHDGYAKRRAWCANVGCDRRRTPAPRSFVRRLERTVKEAAFIKTTKSGRQRTIPLSALAVDTLRRVRTEQLEAKMLNRDRYDDQGLVFADDLGGLLDLDAISKAFSALALEAGIKSRGISLHSCRHFSATQALVAGNDIRTVAALLGHASPSTTLNVYGHVVAGAQERAVAGIGDAILAAQARRIAGQK